MAIGASGGKDSAVLAKVMQVLNERHNYGLELFLLSIDEGISGYRDHSLEEVKYHANTFGLPLKILSYKGTVGNTLLVQCFSRIRPAWPAILAKKGLISVRF